MSIECTKKTSHTKQNIKKIFKFTFARMCCLFTIINSLTEDNGEYGENIRNTHTSDKCSSIVIYGGYFLHLTFL